jgi:hypothetical protein
VTTAPKSIQTDTHLINFLPCEDKTLWERVGELLIRKIPQNIHATKYMVENNQYHQTTERYINNVGR